MRPTVFFIAFALVLGGAFAADGVSFQPPQLIVETDGDLSRLYVETPAADGTVHRALIRETPAIPVIGPAGADPTGRAVFARWTEDGQAFSAFSRDGGRGWSEPRRASLDLRMHRGAIEPGQAMPQAPEGLRLPESGNVFLVQLKAQSLPEFRAALEDAGARLLRFFPHNAHIIHLDPSRTAQVASLDFVERVEPFHPAYRIEEALQAWMATPEPGTDAPESIRVNVVAFTWGEAGKNAIVRDASAFGATVADIWPDGHRFEMNVTRAQLPLLAALPEVAWVDRWSPAETDMDLVRQDSGADWYEAQTSICGQGVRGEVMDSGLETTHKDLGGILLHGSNTTSSHGTSTTGIVFGDGNRDGNGDADAVGGLPCKEQGIFADFDFLSNRFAHTQELKGAPYFASFQSNSWGNARTRAYTSISQEMDDIIFNLDIAILQSQSNAGNQDSRPQAWAKNIISVGGVRHFNTLSTADDSWSGGASIGPAADGRIKPDLNYWYDSIKAPTTGNSYTQFGGTSAATPEAAGILGLQIRQWSDNVWATDPVGTTVFERQPHATTIKAIAINTANQYTFSGTGADLTRMHQGWGRPSAQNSVERAATSFVIDETDVLTVGQTASYAADVSAGESELKVTMIYRDPPGTTSSTLHRINNVDLEVTAPSGTVYHGNVGLTAGNYSAPGGAPNNVDTVENVFIANPEAGSWSIDVTADEVNQDGHPDTPATDQAFALVVTGGTVNIGECGNGIREGREECDGSDIGTATCEDLGCDPDGTPSCNGDCTLAEGSCTGCPVCGDGSCDPGEDCNSCGSDCRTGSGSACGNGVCETADGEDCVSCPSDCNGTQKGKPGNRYCCGDGDGENPVGCGDNRCTGDGNTCSSTSPPASCCGDGQCTGDESSSNCEVDCGPVPFCGDGVCSDAETACDCPEDCGPPPSVETPNITCSDNEDNDCDGLIDCDDPDCQTDPLCDCGTAGTSCVFQSDCCSGSCKGPRARKTCK